MYSQKSVYNMGIISRSSVSRKPNETMRLIVTTFIGIVFGFFIGVSFPTLSLRKMNVASGLLPTIDLSCIEDRKSGISSQTFLNAWSVLKNNNRSSDQARHSNDTSKIWIPSNPRGAERLPPGIVAAESDLYLRRLWGKPSEVCILPLIIELMWSSSNFPLHI